MKTLQQIIMISATSGIILLSGCGKSNPHSLSNNYRLPAGYGISNYPFDYSKNEWQKEKVNDKPATQSINEQLKTMQGNFEQFERGKIDAEVGHQRMMDVFEITTKKIK